MKTMIRKSLPSFWVDILLAVFPPWGVLLPSHISWRGPETLENVFSKTAKQTRVADPFCGLICDSSVGGHSANVVG